MARFAPDDGHATDRAALLMGQLGGIILARYLFCIEPLAIADRTWIVSTFGPTIEHYLTGELPDLN